MTSNVCRHARLLLFSLLLSPLAFELIPFPIGLVVLSLKLTTDLICEGLALFFA